MYSTMSPTYPMQQQIDPATQAFAFRTPAAVSLVRNQFRPLGAPFSHSVGLLSSYFRGAFSNVAQYYMYNPFVWKKLIETQTLKWPGLVGLRGIMAGAEREGAYMGVTGRLGRAISVSVRRSIAVFMKKVESEKYRNAHRWFLTKGVKGFAEYMQKQTGSGSWGKIAKLAGRLGGTTIEMGGKTAAIMGKVGYGMSVGALVYESVRFGMWGVGTAVRVGTSMLDKMAAGIRKMHNLRYKLPDGYRTPEAATMRSRALQEMHASRSNLRNIMLGNEAYYLHR